MSAPTLVFVPGSFAPAVLYADFDEKLRAAGFELETIHLPSTIKDESKPAATVADDAAAIQAVLSKYIDQGKAVHIYTHSYGGIPGTESIKGLAKATREAQGLKGGIARIVYTTALAVPVGMTLRDGMGPNLPDFIKVEGDYMRNEPEGAAKLTFSDLSEAEGLAWAKRMSSHSTASFASPLTYPGYRDVDVSYIVCDNDLVIPLEAQEQMVAFLQQDTGKPVDVHHIKAGHAPHIGSRDDLIDVVRKIAGGTA